MLVSLVAIQAAALSIFLFEWFSPAGHNMKVRTALSHLKSRRSNLADQNSNLLALLLFPWQVINNFFFRFCVFVNNCSGKFQWFQQNLIFFPQIILLFLFKPARNRARLIPDKQFPKNYYSWLFLIPNCCFSYFKLERLSDVQCNMTVIWVLLSNFFSLYLSMTNFYFTSEEFVLFGTT